MLKKNFSFFCILLYLFFLGSCNDSKQGDETQNEEIQTVLVTFFNESSYNVKVHKNSFYGPVITEVNTTNRESKVPVRINDNNGVGTVFSIEYIIYLITDEIKIENGEIFISCYDTNVQIHKIIKAGEPCTIQIPQPVNLACKTALIKIINTHNLPIDFRYAGRILKQAGNDEIPIAPYKQGVYKLDGIPDEGENCQYYNIVSTFDSIYFSDFVSQNDIYITKNAYIFNYEFNGTSIKKTGEKPIVFK